MHEYLITSADGAVTSVRAADGRAAMDTRYIELAENLATRVRQTGMSAKDHKRALLGGEPRSAVHSERCPCKTPARARASDLYA